ncbi:MAG TPA: GUN4 domain-containing protein [Leptolyngbyaceae cyanobacterium M65_K2018_010]|nr:GUN4 domain-containing protein [Leptolyngbyaceae cyanobacterium M65_K2018_010]
MVRDLSSSPLLTFVVKLLEPGFSPDQLEEQAQLLHDDLQALSDLRRTRLTCLYSQRGQTRVQDGVQFEAPADYLRRILRRLCDRLEDRPLETLVVIQQGPVKLAVQTHEADRLASILEAAEALIPPASLYRAKLDAYIRTQGELSPAEEANLELLRQRLGLSPQEAEDLKAIALGPYRTLAEKSQYFESVLMAELARESPLSEATWELLEEVAANLNLPLEVATALYHDHLHRIQVEVEAIRQREQAAAEAAQRTAAQAQEAEQQQQQQLGRQQQLDQYREMVRQILQTTLYAPDFDQGRLEQARRLWKIEAKEALQMEEAIRSELYGSIQSSLDVDYSRLRQLLWGQLWLEADQETENAILKLLGHQMQPLDREAIMHLPCIDLLTIDQLWSRYSNGRFGFAAQVKIFQQVDRRPADFLRAVDWRGPLLSLTVGVKPYKSLQFNASAPQGHLPTWRWCCPSLESGYEVSEAVVDTLCGHLQKCFAMEIPPLPMPLTALGGE